MEYVFRGQPHPVLQAMRYEDTQELAQDCWQQGLHGLVYASAQHPYHSCLCLFSNGMAGVRRLSIAPLVAPNSTRLHKAVVNAAHGSRVPLLG